MSGATHHPILEQLRLWTLDTPQCLWRHLNTYLCMKSPSHISSHISSPFLNKASKIQLIIICLSFSIFSRFWFYPYYSIPCHFCYTRCLYPSLNKTVASGGGREWSVLYSVSYWMQLTSLSHEALKCAHGQHFLLFQSVLFKGSSLYPGPKPTLM